MRKFDDFPKRLKLYAITISDAPFGSLSDSIVQAIQGGATIIQLREKKLDREEYSKRANAVGEICRAHNVPFIVDDSIEVALHSDADGVHVGQEDMSPLEIRAISRDLIVGVSAKTVEQALRAEEMGADYLGVGAIYPTQTKENPIMTSIETLRSICSSTRLPVVAIGGLKAHNIATLANTGIAGICAVTGIFGELDIRGATEKLRAEADKVVDPKYL